MALNVAVVGRIFESTGPVVAAADIKRPQLFNPYIKLQRVSILGAGVRCDAKSSTFPPNRPFIKPSFRQALILSITRALGLADYCGISQMNIEEA